MALIDLNLGIVSITGPVYLMASMLLFLRDTLATNFGLINTSGSCDLSRSLCTLKVFFCFKDLKFVHPC